MSRPAAFAVLALCGLLLFACSSGDSAVATPAIESSTEVHPCPDPDGSDAFGVQPSRLRDVTASSSPTVTASAARPTPESVTSANTGCEGPDFSQRCSLWASDEYDGGGGQDIGCGSTMAQCGCALTSAASLLVHYGVTRGPDGSPTTPASVNEWFKGEARQTAAGTVSRGYVYGGVNWLAVATYSKLAAARFGTPELTWSGVLPSDIGALRRELENGRPVILEEPGHYILATNAARETVAIADPFYNDRTSLDVPAYANRFLSGRLYRPGPDVSGLLVAAPKGVQFTVRDASGRLTGIDPKSSQPVSDIQQSTFSIEAAWRDPTCTASPPRTDGGVQMAIHGQPAPGRYSVDVRGDASGRYSVAVYAYDQGGALTLQTFDGVAPAGGSATIAIDYTPAAGGKQRIEIEPAPAQPGGVPTASPTTPRMATATVAPATPTAVPTAPPKATATPTPRPKAGSVARITLTLAPASFFCDGTTYATAIASAFDAAGNPVPGTPIQFEASPGSIAPTFATTTPNGTASAKLYPPAGGTQVRVTARVPSIVGGPSASATFTCRPILLPPLVP